MSEDALPEPDRLEGAPHPRDTLALFGQGPAEAGFLRAHAAGRMHHAWLLTGPRGVGKATLAWRIARFLLATPVDDGPGLFEAPPPPTSLDVEADHPVSRRLRALSEPGLFLLRRGPTDKGDKLSSDIRVDMVRKLANFLQLSATEGGRRVIIVDAADELNPQAANALLKMLEEPPVRCVFLMISHQPTGLLPTIRSRCRELRLGPLGTEDMGRALDQAGIALPDDPAALTELSAGSVGEAIRLLSQGGLEIYAELVALFARLPDLDRPRALRLAEATAQRGATDRLGLLMALTDLLLARLARTGATGRPPAVEAAPGEAALLARLSPGPARARAWADAAQSVSARMGHGQAVNLDPASLVLDTVFRIQKTAGG
jgi:DNA polymerase III subunit delta'